MKRLGALLGAAAVAVFMAQQAAAVEFGFYNITHNTPSSVDVASQLSVDVTDAGNNQVLFTFKNTAVIQSSITDVYFDDGALLGIAQVINETGVSFAVPANPEDLPGGNTLAPSFVTTAGFSADADPPPSSNGVNASSEELGILFDLKSGKAFANVLTDLASGALRIGLHVQSIGTQSKSDGFVNGGTVPDSGATALLLGLVLLGVEGVRRMVRR